MADDLREKNQIVNEKKSRRLQTRSTQAFNRSLRDTFPLTLHLHLTVFLPRAPSGADEYRMKALTDPVLP